MCLESIGVLGATSQCFQGKHWKICAGVMPKKNREYMFKGPKIEFARLTDCTESFSQPLCPYGGGDSFVKRLVFWRLAYVIYPDLIQVIPQTNPKPNRCY